MVGRFNHSHTGAQNDAVNELENRIKRRGRPFMASPPRLSARKTSHFNGESATLGGGTPCAACGANVYVAERREANGLTFHTDCFRCAVCRKKLNAEWFMSDEDALLCRVHHSQRNMFRGQLVALPERIVPKPVVHKAQCTPDVASPSEEAPLTSLFQRAARKRQTNPSTLTIW